MPSVALALMLSIGPPAGPRQAPGDAGPVRTAAGDSTTVVPPAPDSAVRQLDEVVVTAAGMPTPIGSAAYAAARNGPDVTRRARAGLGLSEPLHAVPGVQVDNRYNHALGERITVRGFGARTQFGVRGVRVIVDGIPATMPDGQTTLNHLDLGTIESVEVVRTPMAALFGNAAGGVIAIRTAASPAAPLAISSRLVTGSDGLMRRQLGTGGTTSAGSYLVHAGRLDYDGYRAHGSADNRYFAARTNSNVGPGSLALTFHHVTYDALNPGALPDSILRRDRSAAFPLNVAQNTGESGRHSQAGVRMERALARYVLATSAYFVRRKLDNPIPPRIIQLSRRAGGARVSLGLAPPEAARLSWDAGMETAVQRDDRLNFANMAGEPGELTLDQEERVRANAVFFTARSRLTDRMLLQVGLRGDVTTFSVADRLIDAANPDDSGARRMRSWNPSLGVSVRAAGETRIFLNVGTAFETPTTTELANRPDGSGGFNPGLEPQKTRSVEAGVNGFTQRIYYQAALYRSRVTGALVPFEIPAAPGRQFYRNAAAARHQGAEFLVAGPLSEWGEVRVAYTWTDARYRDYVVEGISFESKRLPGVAPHRVETIVRAASRRAFMDLESRYQARVPTNDANSAHSGAYATHGVRAGLTQVRWARLSGSPFFGVENLLDRKYNSSVVVNAAGGRYYEPGPGRTLYVGLDLTVEPAPAR